MSERAVNVGVVIHGHERAIDRVIAVVDDSFDGKAGLELAARIVQKKKSTLHAVLVPREGESEPPPALEELLREASKTAGKWLHSDVLTQRNPAALAYQTHGDLVVIGMALADELGLPLDDVPGAERCVVLVRGARTAAMAVAVDERLRWNEKRNREEDPVGSGRARLAARGGGGAGAHLPRHARIQGRARGHRLGAAAVGRSVADGARAARRGCAVGAGLRCALGQRRRAGSRPGWRDPHRPLRSDAQRARRRSLARDRRAGAVGLRRVARPRRARAARRARAQDRRRRHRRQDDAARPRARRLRLRALDDALRQAEGRRPGLGPGRHRVGVRQAATATAPTFTRSSSASCVRAASPRASPSATPSRPARAATIPGYHCWADFYLDGVGWVPVDASEAWKAQEKAD